MSVWAELRRRNIFKVGFAYLLVAWILAQVVSVINEPLALPDWFDTATLVLIALGFPIALLLAWAYELTPDGIKKTGQVPLEQGISDFKGQRLYYLVMGLLVLGVGFLALNNYLPGGATGGRAPVVEDSAALVAPPAADQTAPQVLPNSIAVLPFANLSPDPDNAFFAAGIHDEILNQIAKLKDLNVIARTSVMQYADVARPITEIARELRVKTIMEGSVSYADGRVAIRVQLIDANAGVQLWSESYNAEFADIFGIQADVAMNIANALKAEFSLAEQQAIQQPPTSSAAAYAFYLRAMDWELAAESREAAHSLLDRALALDPGFARAYGAKAALYTNAFSNTVGGTGVARAERLELERRVREYAERAFALDPMDENARIALGVIDLLTWHWSAFRQALPASGEVLQSLEPWAYSWTGQPAEAVLVAERAATLNPNEASAYLELGVVYAYAGDRAASDRSLRRARELVPASPFVQTWLAYNQVALGNVDSAAVELALVEQLLGDNRPVVFLPELAYSYARIGRGADARRIFDEMQALGDAAEIGAGTWAMAYLAIGDEAKALEWLEVVAEEARNHEPDQGAISALNLKMNFLADPTLNEPAFSDVLSRIVGD